MIHTYSPTIRRKEMEAVLTCMVDEKIGPGDMNAKLISAAKELMGFDGAVALRSPAIAFEYIFKALDFSTENAVIFSALAPAYQVLTVEKLGYRTLFADVSEENGLVTFESVQECMKNGGRLLVLAESMGVLPDIKPFLELGIPVVEDISQSALSSYPFNESDAVKKVPAKNSSSEGQENEEEVLGRKAGMYGVYSILGMEEKDIVTAGGGALLIAPGRKEWTVLKHLAEEAPFTDAMTDMNAALAYVELKEFARNEKTRQELFALYSRAVMSGRHKTYRRADGRGSTIYSFPLVLNSGFKDAKAYAQKKNVEIRQAYEDSIIAFRQQEISKDCRTANSLFLRCAAVPLYPRLGQKDVQQIIKVLSTML